MLKTSMTAILLASSFVPAAAPASAMQAIVTQVDKNKDGTMTYHYAIEVDKGETLVPGEAKKGDFVTIYNFYGFVEGSAKAPAGWTFSSEEFGRTPTANGYPLVLPLDVPNTPNLTWTAATPVKSGSRIDGFSATTRVGTMVSGEYAAQVTRTIPSVGIAGTAVPAQDRQAVIGMVPAPTFLAETK